MKTITTQKTHAISIARLSTVTKNAEAKARRKMAKRWAKISHKAKYKKAVAKDSCEKTTCQLKAELFDGIILSLSGKSNERSYRVQKRILRRIVEKRQAQQTHRNVGRTNNRFASYMLHQSASKSMNELKAFQFIA